MNQTPNTQPAHDPDYELGSAEMEAACREEFRYILRQHDQPQWAWPCTTEAMVELLTDAEFAVDRDVILRLIDGKVIPSPKRINGQLRWSASDAWCLVAALEFRRMWRPLSVRHAHKRNQFETMDQLAKANGLPGHFVDLDKWDVDGLLALLLQEGCDLAARAAIVVALKAKGIGK